MNNFKIGFIFIFVFIFSNLFLSAQEMDSSNSSLNVFIDCKYCYEDFIKTEIDYINYVRDRKQADVHILITTQNTGSGGKEYALTLYGHNQFDNFRDTIIFYTKQADTEEDIRTRLVKKLKLGLVRYILQTPAWEKLNISYKNEKTNLFVDKWNNWVFKLNINSYLQGEKASSYTSVYGNFSIKKITEEMKISFSLNESYGENKFDIGDQILFSLSRSQSVNSSVILSAGDHWSYGGYAALSNSTYSNKKSQIYLAPGIEYNLFPYNQSTRKQLRFLYRISENYYRYNEETIYGKLRENLIQQSLMVALDLKQVWGSVSFAMEGSNYLYNFKKNNLYVYSELSLRLIEGLSFTLYGQYAVVHDQLSLPKGDATTEQILLQRKQLESQYQYFSSIGLTYTFGSIYNNIVNTRFGN
ncbi:MAG: hypothetical protein COW85_04380 [Ignavibacteria bacterium CG22_combo_CG10-13_8_21_14_all_37_15]|nr:MAG: hypothetical protein COW85_04380 [Ignavibacteria bacterium CG22_combo_CG10-13_8_21_14_all_37_15]